MANSQSLPGTRNEHIHSTHTPARTATPLSQTDAVHQFLEGSGTDRHRLKQIINRELTHSVLLFTLENYYPTI